MTETTNSPTKPQACESCSRLASRVEELERVLEPLIEIAKGYRVIGYDHDFLRGAIAAGQRALAGKKPADD